MKSVRVAVVSALGVIAVSATSCASYVVEREAPRALVSSEVGALNIEYGEAKRPVDLGPNSTDHRMGRVIERRVADGRSVQPSDRTPMALRIAREPRRRLLFRSVVSGLSLGLIPVAADEVYRIQASANDVEAADDFGDRDDSENCEEGPISKRVDQDLVAPAAGDGTITVRTWIWAPLFIRQLWTERTDPLASQLVDWVESPERSSSGDSSN